jgi:hypothetical protein
MQQPTSQLQALPKLLLFFFTIIILGGCAGQVNILPPLSEKSNLKPNEGVVVARIVNTSAYPLPFNYLTLAPENLNESDKIKWLRLSSLEKPVNSTTVFSSAVPAGNYALSDIYSYISRGEYFYRKMAGADTEFGVFQVKPGEVTDLGTIVYYPKPQEDKYIDTLVRLPETSKGEVLQKHFPFYSFNPELINGWKNDDFDEDRQNTFASMAQNPVTFDDRYLAPDGSVYFLAKLGVIVKRTPIGEWELDAVDTNLELTSISQNEQGDIVVGGAEGKVFYKAAVGDWQDVSLNSSSKVEKLILSQTDLQVLASEQTQLIIYQANLADSKLNWQEINRYSYVKGWASNPPLEEPKKGVTKKNRRITNIALAKIADDHIVSITSQSVNDQIAFAGGDIETFVYAPDTWEIDLTKETPDVSVILNAGALQLGIKKAGFWSWDGKPTYLRYVEDTGVWDEINTKVRTCDGEIVMNTTCEKDGKSVKSSQDSFSLRAIPWFKNQSEALAIATFTDFDFWASKHSSSVKILSTLDGGKTWTDTGNSLPNDYCSSLVPEIGDHLVITCSGATGDVYQSSDDGATWQHVRQHENF